MKRAAAVLLFFAALTMVMTWPMARHLTDEAVPHDDVFFNLWRLEWFAHAMTTPGAHLFDANIFYPARDTFALSDAMLVEDAVAAPLLWLHVEPVLVHNLLMLGAIVLSGAAMFALVFHLTRSRGAAAIGGLVFAFAPFRFEHLMHMELQWAMWSPLAFLFLHRTLERGKWLDGLATGSCVALQTLSSIYYGIFLATLVAVGALLLMVRDRAAPFLAVVRALALGGAIAVVTVAIYARPYAAAHAEVGDRPVSDVHRFSATPMSYLDAPPENWLYGRFEPTPNGDERRLLPGVLPVLLGLFGLLLVRPPSRMLVYVVLLVLAFDLSLGFHGYSFPLLYDHIPAYRSFRALARLGIFVLLFLGVLAAHGYRLIAGLMGPVARRVAFGVIASLILMEYWTAVPLTTFPNSAPAVYRLLAAEPRGVVAEFPVPAANALPGYESEHTYMSTFHWYPIVNGYSGNYPPSYLQRLDRLSKFPDARSIRQLRSDGVRYLVIHGSQYSVPDLAAVRDQLLKLEITDELGEFADGDSTAFLYVLRGPVSGTR